MHTAFTLLRVAAVFGLLGGTLWFLRRTHGVKQSRNTALIQVLASSKLSKAASVSVVRVGDSQYVLGVTDQGIRLIAEKPADATVEAPASLWVPPAKQTAELVVAEPVARKLKLPTLTLPGTRPPEPIERPSFAAALNENIFALIKARGERINA